MKGGGPRAGNQELRRKKSEISLWTGRPAPSTADVHAWKQQTTHQQSQTGGKRGEEPRLRQFKGESRTVGGEKACNGGNGANAGVDAMSHMKKQGKVAVEGVKPWTNTHTTERKKQGNVK